MLTEIDAIDKLLEKSELGMARLKLGRVRVGIQKLLEDTSTAQAALLEAQKELHALNKRRIQTSQALSVLSQQTAAEGSSKKKNGSRRRKRKA